MKKFLICLTISLSSGFQAYAHHTKNNRVDAMMKGASELCRSIIGCPFTPISTVIVGPILTTQDTLANARFKQKDGKKVFAADEELIKRLNSEIVKSSITDAIAGDQIPEELKLFISDFRRHMEETRGVSPHFEMHKLRSGKYLLESNGKKRTKTVLLNIDLLITEYLYSVISSKELDFESYVKFNAMILEDIFEDNYWTIVKVE